MSLFNRKKKKANENQRLSRSDTRPQRVISYYTATRRQLDNFERHTAQTNNNLAYSRFEQFRSSWFTILAVVVLCIVAGYLASLSSDPYVTVSGTQYRTPKEYQAIIGGIFVDSDIRNKTKPLLRVNELEAAISSAIPEAKSVSVSSSFLGHRPEVKIITDEPLAIFSQPNDKDYLLSMRGRLLLPTGEATNYTSSALPIIQNQTGVIAKAGEQFMRPDETTALIRLLAQFKADTSTPIFTLNTTPHELVAQEAGRGGYYIKFLLSETIVTQYGALRATEQKLKELSQSPSEYIDVRLADKAYYK